MLYYSDLISDTNHVQCYIFNCAINPLGNQTGHTDHQLLMAPGIPEKAHILVNQSIILG